MNTFYDDPEMARAYEIHAERSAYNAHYDRPAVLELLGDVSGTTVLDAACGPGLYAEELFRRGAIVQGFDGSPEMVDLARRRAPAANFDVLSLDEPLPFSDASFDAVVCALAIHYAADRQETMAEFHRVLRSGSPLVFSTEHPATTWLRHGGDYFATQIEVDIWHPENSHEWQLRAWREPLTSLCEALYHSGFLIERIVEPRPSDTMRIEWPETYEKLSTSPGFIVFRAIKR